MRCQGTLGCVGFGFAARSNCPGGGYQELCYLWSGTCTGSTNACWDDYTMVQVTECAADYGASVGSPVCCEQSGTVETAFRICGSVRPVCVGYVKGSTWGKCQACSDITHRIHAHHEQAAHGQETVVRHRRRRSVSWNVKISPVLRVARCSQAADKCHSRSARLRQPTGPIPSSVCIIVPHHPTEASALRGRPKLQLRQRLALSNPPLRSASLMSMLMGSGWVVEFPLRCTSVIAHPSPTPSRLRLGGHPKILIRSAQRLGGTRATVSRKSSTRTSVQ